MRKTTRILVAALLAIGVSIIQTAHADWMNLTGAETAPNIAEITVLDDRVRIALEVYVGDLEAFEALLPDLFWVGPAVAIMGDLSFGTILTMIFVPTMYATLQGMNDIRVRDW